MEALGPPWTKQPRQRIHINCQIVPLTRKETEEYILYRLEIAGNREAIKFSNEAFDAIYNFSRGIPRLVNILCDFLMLSAFSEKATVIKTDLVNEVVCDL